MAMGQQKDRQGDLGGLGGDAALGFYEPPAVMVLIEGGSYAFAEAELPALLRGQDGRALGAARALFPMYLVGYFEGIDSERGLEWRCSDSRVACLLRLENRERVPDHSWLSRTRTRLPHEVHTAMAAFDWVLALIAEAGLVKGDRIGVDASTMEANAALRNIVRRDTGEGYRGMLERLAQESGIDRPRPRTWRVGDRKRKGRSSRTGLGFQERPRGARSPR